VTLVKRLLLNKTRDKPLYVFVLLDHIQLQTMTVLIVSQIVKLVQMEHPALLANQRPPRQWQEYFQIVIALYII
jgi:hypothetical protein